MGERPRTQILMLQCQGSPEKLMMCMQIHIIQAYYGLMVTIVMDVVTSDYRHTQSMTI